MGWEWSDSAALPMDLDDSRQVGCLVVALVAFHDGEFV